MEPNGEKHPSGGPHPDPDTGLEESMLQMGLGNGGDSPYPVRPGEPDCAYYMRNGSCGYGERCRYNHPSDCVTVAGAVGTGAAENPESGSPPACLNFVKNGTCKYGSTCKYDHRGQGSGSVHPVLNYFGYPRHPGERECSYYMRTGECKFGLACKFDHPQRGSASVPSPASAFYPAVQSPSVPYPHQYPSIDVVRPSGPAPYIYGPYGPMLLSPGVVPFRGWGPYPPSVSPFVSLGGQHQIQEGPLYGSSRQLPTSAPANYPGPYQMVSSLAGPSSSSDEELIFPVRPGQPDCRYYMRTGDCKFGSACKYNHPPELTIPEMNCTLSTRGLPLRPGAPPCAFYSQHGVCKFGPACKFDHPTGTLSYSPSASSLAEVPVAPYSVESNRATASSSSELGPESSSSSSSSDPGGNISTSR